MKKSLSVVLVILFALVSFSVFAQSRAGDIPFDQVPDEVLEVLNQYVSVLNSETLEKCAAEFFAIAGGSLVNPDGTALDIDLPKYSLKKDYENIKFYAQPLKITRINRRWTNGDGYGKSALAGWIYKIWIAKKPGTPGMPAPISIIVAKNHPTIKSPKVIGIGSL